MPKPPRRQFAEDLLPLQRNYLRRVAGYIGDIRRLRELVRTDFMPVYDLQRILRLSHNLSGSGATFGYPTISRTATILNEAIQEFLENDHADPGTRSRQQAEIIEKLHGFEAACTQVITAQTSTAPGKAAPLRLVQAEKTVYLIATVPGALALLADKMRSYGLVPKLLLSVDEIKGEFFHALVVYSEDPLRDLAAFPTPPGATLTEAPPFILISPADTFEARLAAVRAGAHVYLSPDAEPAEIIKMIDDLTGHEMEPVHKAHILLSDGDGMSATFYAHTLQMAGFDVSVAPTPVRVLDVLATRQVDLFITGLNFPGCNGFELAAVVRQFASFKQKILFVADQQEFDALVAGSLNAREENFLIKPFNPSQLVTMAGILLARPQAKTA